MTGFQFFLAKYLQEGKHPHYPPTPIIRPKSIHKTSRSIQTHAQTDFSMLSIPQLIAWYKADTLNLNDGDQITNVHDLSPLNLDLLPSEDTPTPVFSNQLVPSHPLIVAHNDGPHLLIRNIPLPQPFLIIMAAAIFSEDPNPIFTNQESALGAAITPGQPNTISMFAENTIQASLTPGSNAHTFAFLFNGPDSRLFIDSLTPAATGDVGSTGTGDLAFFGLNTAQTYTAEIAIFSPIPSAPAWAAAFNDIISRNTFTIPLQ